MITVYKSDINSFVIEASKIVYVQKLWRKLTEATIHELILTSVNKQGLVVALVIRSLSKEEIEEQFEKAQSYLTGEKKQVTNGVISEHTIVGDLIK
jgi:hypothetical protein